MEAITKQQWDKINNDNKSIIDNEYYILKLIDKGTCLVPVDVID